MAEKREKLIFVEEILKKVITIEAESEKEAIRLVSDLYDEANIVLKWDDLYEFNIYPI